MGYILDIHTGTCNNSSGLYSLGGNVQLWTPVLYWIGFPINTFLTQNIGVMMYICFSELGHYCSANAVGGGLVSSVHQSVCSFSHLFDKPILIFHCKSICNENILKIPMLSVENTQKIININTVIIFCLVQVVYIYREQIWPSLCLQIS